MECPAGCSGGACVAPKVQRTVSAGKFFTCGVSKAGAVKCWGSNQRGELGNPEVVGVGKMVDIVGLSSDVVALSTGTGATCAITAAGAVECWGSSLYDELGAGTTESSDVPVEVVGF